MDGMASYFEFEKIRKQISKEMHVEPWVFINIAYRSSGEYTSLYVYDLPREVAERREWVFRWRECREQCKYPKNRVSCYYSFYNKKLGRGVEINELQSKIISAKAQVTKVKKRVKEYIAYEQSNNMFFDEATNQQLCKVRVKLESKESNLEILVTQMNDMLRNLKD